MKTQISIIKKPTTEDWIGVKQRALVTIGKSASTPPTEEWKVKMLNAQHSPIRFLMFSFLIENLPSWVATHLSRHVHAQPYIQTQRNDRQKNYDRNAARQDVPVNMIWDVNAEELITIAHKRLCTQASLETRQVVQEIVNKVLETNPEFESVLVPMCAYRGGLCTEFNCCGLNKKYILKGNNENVTD